MTARQGRLLLVDDDETFARVLSRTLGSRGFDVASATSIDGARALIADGTRPPRYALLDLNLAGESGLQLVAPLRQSSPACRIVVLTGYASIPTAVDAIKLGADHYLAKPIEIDAIVRALLGTQAPDPSTPPQDMLSVQRLEWEHIQRALAEHGGNVSAAARALKMHRRTLQRKLGKRPSHDG
ncbi:MAG TPA: response regulator transcription factor [Burkholderiaceae bacterium]|nr:response regulator transcription factor [Burkholderiaceae bacterium]